MRKLHRYHLTDEERQELREILRKHGSAKKHRGARILLLADEAREGGPMIDREIAEVVGCCRETVETTRRRMVEGGIQKVLEPAKSKRVYLRKLNGAQEAKLIALCCQSPPEGRVRWTLHLLADKLVELEIVDSISHEAVRQVLNKNKLKPWQKKQWCIPPLGQR